MRNAPIYLIAQKWGRQPCVVLPDLLFHKDRFNINILRKREIIPTPSTVSWPTPTHTYPKRLRKFSHVQGKFCELYGTLQQNTQKVLWHLWKFFAYTLLLHLTGCVFCKSWIRKPVVRSVKPNARLLYGLGNMMKKTKALQNKKPLRIDRAVMTRWEGKYTASSY